MPMSIETKSSLLKEAGKHSYNNFSTCFKVINYEANKKLNFSGVRDLTQ